MGDLGDSGAESEEEEQVVLGPAPGIISNPSKGSLSNPSKHWAGHKCICKTAIGRVTRRMHKILVEQRAISVAAQPELNVGPLEQAAHLALEAHRAIRAERELQLREANTLLRERVDGVVEALVALRQVVRLVEPRELTEPAVLALAISGPSTSWSMDLWANAPMPQCVDAIATIFKAAYSNPVPKENRLPQKRTHKKRKLGAEDN